MTVPPRDSRWQYRVLGLALLLGCGTAFHLYFANPRREELAELAARVEHAERANALAELPAGDLDAIRESLELGERQLAVLKRLVPREGEVEAIYEAIAAETQSLGLELVHALPADPVADSTGYFVRQQWALQVEGAYHDVGMLLTRIAGFARIVRPEVEEIAPSRITNSGRQLVHARFRLESFVLPPEDRASPEEG
ncbi:type 4a pilus biogenesis protein PilO [Candidatus Palauibacter polyketidifaciens]|uniref:type 4a pilus biogenesis protein PilO n=1 Tax=Candidatus Palauibacter polyketidifaciens TaxID=3056740 RepID=UPI00238C592B|nr:type 4a pilus biogenesis protein PilO [Candidatus Palauibacter polyketidifaciens]MDE2719926.1 type 4a pilus biogenesis protein PilO [Candidatus Palauibacter polyketidifaciens]